MPPTPGCGPWVPRFLLPAGGGRTRSRLGRRSRRRGAARFFYAWPVLFDPGGDRLVVAFDRAPRRTLSAPPQPLTQHGHVCVWL